MFESPKQSGIAHDRIQLYVDDPAVVLSGDTSQQQEAMDVLVLWWLILGFPLSWKKGSFNAASVSHTWVGVNFILRENATTMSLPADFLKALLMLAQKFADPNVKVATLQEAQEICGRAGRVGQVVPEAKPFVSNFYGALAGSLRAHEGRSREAPSGRVATRRYRLAAQWLVKLLVQDSSAPLKLQTQVFASSPCFDPQICRVEYDASPYGGAAILFDKGVLSEWLSLDWQHIPKLHVKTGESRHQTFRELLTLTLVIIRWCPILDNILFCGDSVASLQLAITHKSRVILAVIGRELAWRQAKFGWRYAVAHLPAEANKLADRLSRLSDPTLPPLTHQPAELEGAARANPHLEQLWSLP